MIIDNDEVDKGNFGDILGKKAIGSSVWQEEMKKLGAVTLQNINNKEKNIYETWKH